MKWLGTLAEIKKMVEAIEAGKVLGVTIIYTVNSGKSYHHHSACLKGKEFSLLNSVQAAWGDFNNHVMGELSSDQREALGERDGETIQ